MAAPMTTFFQNMLGKKNNLKKYNPRHHLLYPRMLRGSGVLNTSLDLTDWTIGSGLNSTFFTAVTDTACLS